MKDTMTLLENLAEASANYRKTHDLRGDGHKETGRAWDLMRRAETSALEHVALYGRTYRIDPAYRGPTISFTYNPPYYLASCDKCGWVGSSEYCGTDKEGDDSDVYCPRCHAPGADCGKVADLLPAQRSQSQCTHPEWIDITVVGDIGKREQCASCPATRDKPGSDEWLKRSAHFHPGDIA